MDSSISESVDVLIAGAGPAGSAAALLLARAGHRVLAADRAAFPRDKPCADYLSPGALRVLDRLGVLAEAEALGAPLRGIRVTSSRGGRLEGVFAEAPAGRFGSVEETRGLCLPRRELDLLLVSAARAAGASIAERTMVEALVHADGGVGGAVLRDAAGTRRVVTARVTIGADGLRSATARAIGVRMHHRPRRVAFVAHLEGIGGEPGLAEMLVGARGYAGLNPLAGGLTNAALVVPAGAAHAARGDPESFFLDGLAQFAGLRRRMSAARVVRRVLVTGPFAAQSGTLVTDGAALVGDAANFFDPFTGEGVCSALRGAELLAGVLADALAVPGPVRRLQLEPYVAARRRAFAGKRIVERLIGAAMAFPAIFDHAIRRIERRGLAHTLVGVTGEFLPARAVLNPSFLARAVL
ncbi:MAG TPA: FAD-dependent monooxygenase [Gemmatimonadales bacterium]|nr:FAD-dependent monooxygenase [Gemmatimonadales bacterium]